MASQTLPGPTNKELLFLHQEHRACRLFYNLLPDTTLNVRRSDRAFWEYIRTNPIPDNVMVFIREAGFGGVIDCGYRRVDHGLITALVERWRPETHTFHLPIGEATITLEDIQVFWGLPVEGGVVTGCDCQLTPDDLSYVCREYLGFSPTPDSFKGSHIKLKVLLEAIKTPLPHEPSLLDLIRRARLYIMHLLGGTLCPDSSGCRVAMFFLRNLIDIPGCGRLSWGSAILANLYRNLCKATSSQAIEVAGPLVLLQLWAWERIPSLAPAIVDGNYNFQLPYGARWSSRFHYTETPSHVLKVARYQLSTLQEKDFVWAPYQNVFDLLPQCCISGQQSWRCDTFIICWEIVEPHLPNRVMRQFCMFQPIPTNHLITSEIHQKLHKLTRGGSKNTNWKDKHAEYIGHWHSRHEHLVKGKIVDTFRASREYMNWYRERTVIHIQSLNEPHKHDFQNHEGSLEVLMDGMSQIYDIQQPRAGNEPREIARQYIQRINANERFYVQQRHFTNDLRHFPRPLASLVQHLRRRGNKHGRSSGCSVRTINDDERRTSNVHDECPSNTNHVGPSNSTGAGFMSFTYASPWVHEQGRSTLLGEMHTQTPSLQFFTPVQSQRPTQQSMSYPYNTNDCYILTPLVSQQMGQERPPSMSSMPTAVVSPQYSLVSENIDFDLNLDVEENIANNRRRRQYIQETR